MAAQVEGVRLYHDQALYKEAGGGPTPWHADQYYWPLTTDRIVTAWIPLQPVSADMGPLAFAERTHTKVGLEYHVFIRPSRAGPFLLAEVALVQ